MRLPGRFLNPTLSMPEREVVLIEVVACEPGDRFILTFESSEPRWRQGVWFAVDGELEVAAESASQVVLWRETAPDAVEVTVRSTSDGLMRFYNVWDSGRGMNIESQSATSGMLREEVTGGHRYRCSDINPAPTFGALVFSLTRA